MNAKAKNNKNQVNNNFSVINILSADERQSRINDLLNTMQAKTWHNLETSGKFDKNAKLSFISVKGSDPICINCKDVTFGHCLQYPSYLHFHLKACAY